MTMHHRDHDAHAHLSARVVLPPHRRISTGRTYSTLWDPIRDAAAFHHVRARANALDRLCWIASAALCLASAWVAWG